MKKLGLREDKCSTKSFTENQPVQPQTNSTLHTACFWENLGFLNGNESGLFIHPLTEFSQHGTPQLSDVQDAVLSPGTLCSET